jgi:hypothetical protein
MFEKNTIVAISLQRTVSETLSTVDFFLVGIGLL